MVVICSGLSVIASSFLLAMTVKFNWRRVGIAHRYMMLIDWYMVGNAHPTCSLGMIMRKNPFSFRSFN